MPLTFASETWWKVKPEIAPLWQRHWEEIAHDKDTIPLDPDWNSYDGAAALGKLAIMAARDENAKLQGYLFALVTGHMHYQSTLCAFYDLFWLAPEHRTGWNGYHLMKAAEDMLRDMRVKKAFGQTKLAHDMSAIFRRLKWKPVETVFAKTLR